jgi:hypothetical protein
MFMGMFMVMFTFTGRGMGTVMVKEFEQMNALAM